MSQPSNPSHVRPAPQRRADADLHVCPHCRSVLVKPVHANEPAAGVWDLTLRCPECERFMDVRCDTAGLQRYEEELGAGLESLQRELTTQARLNFAEDVERFVAALRADAVFPMDFGPAR